MNFSALTAAHRHEEIENRPCQDDDVVDVHPAGHDSGSVTDALEQGRYLEDSQAAHREHLTEGQFHEKHGYTSEKQRQEVRDEEGTAAILIAKVRKSPDVAKTDRQADLE